VDSVRDIASIARKWSERPANTFDKWVLLGLGTPKSRSSKPQTCTTKKTHTPHKGYSAFPKLWAV